MTERDSPTSWPSLEVFWPAVSSAAERLGTPLYVYFPAAAKSTFERTQSALSGWGRGILAYSVKTNPFIGLLHDLRSWGAGAEVVSEWEYDIALRAGFAPRQLVLNGPLKTREGLTRIVRRPPLTINIDSLDELATLQRVVGGARPPLRVGVRLCPLPTSGESRSRFGLECDTGEVTEAITRIQATRGLTLASIHVHVGTQVRDMARCIAAVRQARLMWSQYGLGGNTYLDMGGGFPYDHDRPMECQEFSAWRFLAALRQAWDLSIVPRLIIEPGRIIAAPCFAVVSRVLSCKPRVGEPSIVVLDTGTNHNVMGAFYDHLWRFQQAEEDPGEFRFCGSLCMEDDILSGVISGVRPQVGSLVGMFNAGAYSLSLARAFIQPRPAIISMMSDGRTRLESRRETLRGAYGQAKRVVTREA